MEKRASLIRMLRQLVEDMAAVQQQGAGSYSCAPVASRFNRLVGQGRTLFPAGDGLMETFDELPLTEPKDPGDKFKVLQAIRIEIGQLITLLDSSSDGD